MAHVGPEPWLDDQAVLNDMLRADLVQLPPHATPRPPLPLVQCTHAAWLPRTYERGGLR